jgi:hypothetical protein
MSPKITERSLETAIECGLLQHTPAATPLARLAVRLTRGPPSDGPQGTGSPHL